MTLMSVAEIGDAAVGLLAPLRMSAASRRTLTAGSASNGASSVIDVLRPEGRLIGEAGTSSKIRIVEGGAAEAETLFKELTAGGKAVEGSSYPGQLVELPGGGRIGFRPTSTSGPPTIDVMGVEGSARGQVHSRRRMMAGSEKGPMGNGKSPSTMAGLPSEDLAAIIIDALLRANIVAREDVKRALKIATEEIDVRKSLGDY